MHFETKIQNVRNNLEIPKDNALHSLDSFSDTFRLFDKDKDNKPNIKI